MSTITQEQVIQIEVAAKAVLWPIGWTEKKARAHFSKKVTPEIVLELARIARAYMDIKPPMSLEEEQKTPAAYMDGEGRPNDAIPSNALPQSMQVDIEMLASALRNVPLAPSDSQGITRTRVVKHQITGSMAKDIALKLGAELNDEEADIFADGYNAAVLNAEPLSGNFPLKRSLRDGIEIIRNAGIPVDADKIQSERNAGNLDGLNIRAVAALCAAVRNQWLKSDNFADKVYWKNMHSIANEIVEAMMQNEPSQPSDNHIPSREAIIAGGVLVQCPRCHGDSYRLKFNGWNHYWCDKCANAITSEDK
ncbi:hypothetical protein C2920_21700 [Salmonella enterica]|nr:hypothetical protein [Salmonella enterica]